MDWSPHGHVVLDVGAHLGAFTVFAAIGGARKVSYPLDSSGCLLVPTMSSHALSGSSYIATVSVWVPAAVSFQDRVCVAGNGL